jgi:hypothetical protein
MGDFGPVRDHHVVEQVAEVRLIDLRRGLHRFRGQSNLVADDACTLLHLLPDHLTLYRIGVFDTDVRERLRQLQRRLTILFGREQNSGSSLTVGIGQHV